MQPRGGMRAGDYSLARDSQYGALCWTMMLFGRSSSSRRTRPRGGIRNTRAHHRGDIRRGDTRRASLFLPGAEEALFRDDVGGPGEPWWRSALASKLVQSPIAHMMDTGPFSCVGSSPARSHILEVLHEEKRVKCALALCMLGENRREASGAARCEGRMDEVCSTRRVGTQTLRKATGGRG